MNQPYIDLPDLEVLTGSGITIAVVDSGYSWLGGVTPSSFRFASPAYTLPSIILLFGTVPDAYVLVVNPNDSENYIQELGKVRVIATVCCDKEHVPNGTGRVQQIKWLSQNELNHVCGQLSSRFGIPVTEVATCGGVNRLVTSGEDFFCEKEKEECQRSCR